MHKALICVVDNVKANDGYIVFTEHYGPYPMDKAESIQIQLEAHYNKHRSAVYDFSVYLSTVNSLSHTEIIKRLCVPPKKEDLKRLVHAVLIVFKDNSRYLLANGGLVTAPTFADRFCTEDLAILAIQKFQASGRFAGEIELIEPTVVEV